MPNTNKMTNSELSQSMKKILVVGDWVVDDHWVTGIHRSPTSSRTGRSHYRAVHPLNSAIQSFCAAGRTASILHQATCNLKKFCDIIGVGIWHDADTETLATMLDPSAVKAQTLHRLTRDMPSKDDRVKLYNLGEVLSKKGYTNGRDYSYGTTRVIRVYQHTGAKIDLVQRIDWELPFPYDKHGWITNKEILKESKFGEDLKKEKIDAVVIKDICKGVVSKELISLLVEIFGNIPWFVSTKAWWPDWFAELKKIDLRLLVIPQVAAEKAIRIGRVNCWITRSGNASKDALREMDDLAGNFKKTPLTIALPNGLSLLVRNFTESETEGIMQTKVEAHPLAVEVPMASVFYAALVAKLLNVNQTNGLDIGALLKEALHFTQNWMGYEAQRVEKPEEWDPSNEPVLELNPKKEYIDVGTWRPFVWTDAKEEWQQAFSDFGIIGKKDGKKSLELWRAMTEVDGYVCCTDSKRKALQKLVEELGSFKAKGKQEPKSAMLVASPGSGKTFLVRCLAKSIGLRYLPFNITQMLSKTDILDCFDTVVTTQVQNREESILVFIDEINAKLQNEHVYDTFLAPIEEGVYVRGGKTFHIDPCVWVFAGTERSVKENDPLRDKSTKASDFESRLTIPPLDIKIDVTREMNELRTEKVYLGVTLLRSVFPDVRKVSGKVLEVFHGLRPDLEVRELANFVKSFIDIQYGEVLARNVPTIWLEEHQSGIDIIDWKAREEGEMVEIIG